MHCAAGARTCSGASRRTPPRRTPCGSAPGRGHTGRKLVPLSVSWGCGEAIGPLARQAQLRGRPRSRPSAPGGHNEHAIKVAACHLNALRRLPGAGEARARHSSRCATDQGARARVVILCDCAACMRGQDPSRMTGESWGVRQGPCAAADPRVPARRHSSARTAGAAQTTTCTRATAAHCTRSTAGEPARQ